MVEVVSPWRCTSTATQGEPGPFVYTVTLKASGHQFQVAPGETVLEAARRAGVALAYSCLSGACGSCKATLLEGRCEYPLNPPLGLTADDRAHHAVLLCQTVPASDLVLDAREVASLADIAPRRLDVRVTKKWRLSRDVIGLQLQALSDENRLHWLPGQYLDVMLDDGRRRPFSIANGPRSDGLIELHVRHVDDGGFTSWVEKVLAAGDVLTIEGPQGTLVPREDSERPMIFMAGGTGFAPVKAIVEHFLELGTRRRMDVYWGARRTEDVYLISLAEAWIDAAHDLRFHAVLSEPGANVGAGRRIGLVHHAVLADYPDLSGHDVYMSGPPPMIDAAREQFIAAGLPQERLYYDSFGYAPDVLGKIIAGRAGLHAKPRKV